MKKRKIIYKSGQKITLFDASKHKRVGGSLMFKEKRALLYQNFSVTDFITKFRKYEKLLENFYSTLAFLFLLISFVAISSVVTPILVAGFNSLLPKPNPKPSVIVEKKWSGESLAQFNEREQKERAQFLIKDFKIIIPKIYIESNIIDNVDTLKEKEYKEQLKNGVAHAKGSYLPYENGPVYLFSHSTDSVFNVVQYNAKFYALKDLEVGDDVKIVLNEIVYNYKVNFKHIINPEDIETVRQMDADLILQTCWPPGTDWQRLIVYAEKV